MQWEVCYIGGLGDNGESAYRSVWVVWEDQLVSLRLVTNICCDSARNHANVVGING